MAAKTATQSGDFFCTGGKGKKKLSFFILNEKRSFSRPFSDHSGGRQEKTFDLRWPQWKELIREEKKADNKYNIHTYISLLCAHVEIIVGFGFHVVLCGKDGKNYGVHGHLDL